MDMHEAVRPCWMEIDLAALEHNVRSMRRHLGPDIHIIAALKADAYGHGVAPVAKRLAGCDVHSLATGSFEDALEIRRAGVELPILMFASPLPEGMPHLLAHGITPTVHDRSSAEAVSRAARQPTPVYLKIDSGLGRLGAPLSEALDFVRFVAGFPNLEVEGVYTHLSFHDADGLALARTQYAAFDAFLDALAAEGIHVPITQALASSAMVAGIESRANAVCPGNLLYGMMPVDPTLAVHTDYRPVVRAIKSRLIHAVPGRVGVAPIGVVDGNRPIRPGQSASVLLAGRRVPIRGVSLEYVTLDFTDVNDAEVGDEVMLLGRSGDESITLEELAAWRETSVHDILLAFEGRLRARYLDESESEDGD